LAGWRSPWFWRNAGCFRRVVRYIGIADRVGRDIVGRDIVVGGKPKPPEDEGSMQVLAEISARKAANRMAGASAAAAVRESQRPMFEVEQAAALGSYLGGFPSASTVRSIW
jgi:hypothetical protein